MQVRLSETTYKRLVVGLGEPVSILSTDEHGFHYIDMDEEIIKHIRKSFPERKGDLDWAINQVINNNQARGLWPAAKTSKLD